MSEKYQKYQKIKKAVDAFLWVSGALFGIRCGMELFRPTSFGEGIFSIISIIAFASLPVLAYYLLKQLRKHYDVEEEE